jgi:hypothetical protein
VSATRVRLIATVLACAALATAPAAAHAQSEAEQPQWRLEQPLLPGAAWAVPLGSIGDIEFLEGAPNRGLLITGGYEPAIEPGVWTYDGERWHELSNKCGAAHEGRIAWAGPDDFWTVSDGRPGQAAEALGTIDERRVPLSDNTLCHFQNGQIAASYAHPAFEADSYQLMSGAACLSPNDCWFGGEPLPEPQIGAFHLHWNGSALEAEPYLAEGYPVRDMLAFDDHIIESVQPEPGDRTERTELVTTPVLHLINPPGLIPVSEAEDEAGAGLPFYEEEESPQALQFFHLSGAEGTLWGAAGALQSTGLGQLTVAVREDGSWRVVIGPASRGGRQLEHILPPEDSAEERELVGPSLSRAKVTAIAAEPGTDSAWIGLEHAEAQEKAVLVHINAQGELLSERTLPDAEERAEGVGDKGAAARLACPQAADCWLATSEGWLYHFAPAAERTLPRNGDPDFEHLISYRPPDQGLPQVEQDAPPEDTSGLHERGTQEISKFAESTRPPENRVTLPLLSRVHSRLLKGTEFELSFRLSVKARVRLVAKRGKLVVAATATHKFSAGERKLVLQLDPHRWPTKLSLQTKALEPLRVVSSTSGEGANIGTITTGLFVSPLRSGAGSLGLLP